MATAFWRRFTALCEQNKTTPNAVMLETGLNTGNPTAWKNGRTPGTKTAKIIAEHFGVTVDYLLGVKENAQEGGAVEDDLKFALFGGGGEITDEMFAEVKAFAAYVRAREDAKNKK